MALALAEHRITKRTQSGKRGHLQKLTTSRSWWWFHSQHNAAAAGYVVFTHLLDNTVSSWVENLLPSTPQPLDYLCQIMYYVNAVCLLPSVLYSPWGLLCSRPILLLFSAGFLRAKPLQKHCCVRNCVSSVVGSYSGYNFNCFSLFFFSNVNSI